MLNTAAIGNIGADAVIRHTNGKLAISFPIAHNEKYVDKQGNRHEKTIWIDCTIWRDSETKLLGYLKKGQMVYVEGNPSTDAYVQKETGELMSAFRLNVRKLELLGGKTIENQSSSNGNGKSTGNKTKEETSDWMK